MNLSSLTYFVTVADCGSYTKASQQLFVTQPALSRQISALEDELGEPLFIRKSKSLELTPAGEICLKEARHIIEHCNDMQAKVHQLGGELDIVYCTGMSAVSDVLKIIYEQYNDIRVHLRCVKPALVPTLLSERKADLAIALDLAFENSPDIVMTTLLKEEVCVFVPEHHNLADKEKVKINELSNEKFIMGERSMGPEGVDYTVSLCSKGGFRPKSSCYVNDIQSALYMVSAGQGIAIATTYAEQLHIPGVRMLRISDISAPVNLVLARHISNLNNTVSLLMSSVKKRFSSKI